MTTNGVLSNKRVEVLVDGVVYFGTMIVDTDEEKIIQLDNGLTYDSKNNGGRTVYRPILEGKINEKTTKI